MTAVQGLAVDRRIHIVNILLPSLGAYERGLKDAVAENLKKNCDIFQCFFEAFRKINMI